MVGFEVVTLVASMFGVMVGLGKFREGPALATLMVGGCVFVGAVLAEPTFATRAMGGGGQQGTTGMGVSLLGPALARIAAGLGLVVLSGVIPLSRDFRAARPWLVRAVVLGVPALGLAASPRLPVVGPLLRQMPTAGAVLAGVLGFLVFTVLFSAAVHCAVRALETGRAR
ncbi:MAG: hypothetical protein IBJ11_11665 [Phycisphaerales bacterium]|nr:hypothetical protein [Phycisphaerales bacterium]